MTAIERYRRVWGRITDSRFSRYPPSIADQFWTRAEVLALPDDGNRHELVDGALLVSPSPRRLHQRAVAGLFRRLDPYVRAHRLGEVLFSPADLDLGLDQLVQPDLFVTRPPRANGAMEWSDVGVPLLVVEVVSPATARYDWLIKRRLYQRAGVPTYWIVDLDARVVEQWTPNVSSPGLIDQQLDWQPDSLVPALKIDAIEFFRGVSAP